MSKHLVLLINSYAKYFLIYILILTGLHKRLVFNRQQNREILLGSTFTSLCSCCIFSSYLLIIQSQKKKKKTSDRQPEHRLPFLTQEGAEERLQFRRKAGGYEIFRLRGQSGAFFSFQALYRLAVVIFGDAEGHLKEFVMGLWCEKERGWPALLCSAQLLPWLLTSLSQYTLGHFHFFPLSFLLFSPLSPPQTALKTLSPSRFMYISIHPSFHFKADMIDCCNSAATQTQMPGSAAQCSILALVSFHFFLKVEKIVKCFLSFMLEKLSNRFCSWFPTALKTSRRVREHSNDLKSR